MKDKYLFDWVKKLITNNLEVYLVGGTVRDYLLNIEPKDLDFLVVGSKDLLEISNIINKFGKVDIVGQSFGVLKLTINGETYDIAIPRKETKVGDGHTDFIVETENVSLQEDMYRRDFTMNSIVYDIVNDCYLDFYKGMDDIYNKIINVTNPKAFIEDPLRILRATQFSSRFGFNIHYDTRELILNNKHNLKYISIERIIIELDKIYYKGDINLGFELLNEFNIFNENIHNLLIEDIQTRADFYFVLNDDSINDKLDNETKTIINDIKKLYNLNNVLNGIDFPSNIRMELFTILYKNTGIMKSGVLPKIFNKYIKEFETNLYPFSYKQLNINGDTLMLLGFKGIDIKSMLNQCLIKIFSNDLINDKDVLYNFCKELRDK